MPLVNPAALSPNIPASIASSSVPWRRVSCAVTARPCSVSRASDEPSISIDGASWRLLPPHAPTPGGRTMRGAPLTLCILGGGGVLLARGGRGPPPPAVL